jgi:hypothetical protein
MMEVYICSNKMRNRSVWHTLEEMSQSFDSLEKNTKTMGIMKELQLVNEMTAQGSTSTVRAGFLSYTKNICGWTI